MVFPGNESKVFVVDHFKQVALILKLASSVSCSLGPGQSSLAELLSECGPVNNVPILAFENTLSPELSTNGRWKVLHTITDRICSDRKSRDSERCVWVRCEKYISIVAAETVRDAFNPEFVGDGRPVHLVPENALEFHRQKKRALVNSLHQLLALLCLRALSERDLPSEGQYLPLVMAWFAKEHPDFYHSIQLYKRLRSLQLVWSLVDPDDSPNDFAEAAKAFYKVEHYQEVYDAMLQEAQKAIDRFSLAPDELRRLIDPENLKKELKNYREHVLEPIHFIWSARDKIKKCALYEKPSFSDLEGLEEVLTESFLLAMDKAMSSTKNKRK